ncbi:MAG: universal stress protein [Chloroflexi bacterium]|nr:universal stress protein [Chloroflexota bacterium]
MKFSKILVPVKGHAVDEQAIRLACQTARQDKAKVLAVTVMELHRTLPLESESPTQIETGEAVLEHAERAARNVGVQIETELLQARVAGPILLELANDRGIDLIILGIPYRPPLDEIALGTTPRHIFRNARCQVWLCRQEAVPEPNLPKK